jgi:hypothetical protein
MYLPTVDSATSSPSIRNSPRIRGATPQRVLTTHAPNLRTRLPGDLSFDHQGAKMTNNLQSTSADGGGIIEFDAIVIGASVSGFCRLYHFRRVGLKVRLFE